MSAPFEGDSNKKGQPGIVGKNTSGGDGVWGEADPKPGRGVVGVSDAGTGVWGDTKTGQDRSSRGWSCSQPGRRCLG